VERLQIPQKIDPFVKEIIWIKSKEGIGQHKIPFYADGFAGIAFSKSEIPFTIQPHNKILPDFYLYGQTIIPMTLETEGTFELYAIRLFPFTVRMLIGVDPQTLNDECYDLQKVEGINTSNTIAELRNAKTQSQVVQHMTDYFDQLLKKAGSNPDQRIILASNMILKSNGNIKVNEIQQRLHISERTLERQFKKEMGVTAMQFTKIIQFHSSVKLMSEEDYINLTDVGFKSGYADQSHFIRSFKKFTGKTPKEFQKMLSL